MSDKRFSLVIDGNLIKGALKCGLSSLTVINGNLIKGALKHGLEGSAESVETADAGDAIRFQAILGTTTTTTIQLFVHHHYAGR